MVLTINLETFFWFIGGISGTIGLFALIYKNLPSTKLEKRVNELTKYVDNDNKRINSLEDQMKDVHVAFEEVVKQNAAQSNVILKGMLTLTEINASVADKLGIDDCKDKLNKYREELNEYLLK